MVSRRNIRRQDFSPALCGVKTPPPKIVRRKDFL